MKEEWRMPRRAKTTGVDLMIEPVDPRMMICVLSPSPSVSRGEDDGMRSLVSITNSGIEFCCY